jgi:hypothetical protein
MMRTRKGVIKARARYVHCWWCTCRLIPVGHTIMRNTETGEAPVYVHNVCAVDMKRDAPEWEEVRDQRSGLSSGHR